MRKFRTIILLVVVLGVLIGAYAFLANRPKENENKAPETIVVSELNKDDIVKMELISDNGTLAFTKKGEEWTMNQPYPVGLNQDEINDIASSFAFMDAERVVEENPTDLEQYGLKNPAAEATAVMKDGTTHTFYLGKKAPAGSFYYLMPKDEKKIYAVWLNHGNNFSNTLPDVLDKSLKPIDGQKMTYFRIEREDKPTIEIKYNQKEGTDEPEIGVSLWQMVQPFSQPMSVDGADFNSAVLDVLPNLRIKDFVDPNPSDLSKYGLDKPWGELVIRDDKNMLHLFFGSKDENGMVYFRQDDSNAVYTMDGSQLSFMDDNAFDWVVKFAFIVNIDDVDKIVVDGNGKTHTLTLSRTTQKAEKEGEEDTVVTTYKVDGKEVQEKAFKKFYTSLIGLIVDTDYKETVEENPEVRTTFYLNKGSQKEVHVNYVPYNEDFYAVFRDGASDFVISRDRVQKMLQNLEDLIQGKLDE